MPLNGLGTYTAPASTWNPAVTNTTVSSTDWAALLADLSTALSTMIAKDGQSTPTANIPMGSFKLTGLAAGNAAGNSLRYEQLFTTNAVALLGAMDWVKGADVASAATTNLTTATGNAVHVTGTTTITAVTLGSGMWRLVIFDGALTLTHHATNNNLPGAANITTVAGDRALYWSDGTTVYCVVYQPVGGKMATLTGTEVLTNKTLTSPTVNGAVTGSSVAIGTGSGTGTHVVVANVQTTTVGNVGGGTDDLMSYTLPANSLSANGKAVRVTAWGQGANNANAKTLTFFFGTNISVQNLDTGTPILWRAEALIIRTGASTQRIFVTWYWNAGANTASANQRGITTGAVSASQTDTATITLKFLAAATTDNDITQEGLIVEFLN